MKKIGKYKLIILFLAFLFIVPILTAMERNTSISNIENRTLASLPVYTAESLFNGDYFKQWEAYIADHIVGRDWFIKTYTLLNMNILGKHRINDIVIGKEDTLLPYYNENLSNSLDKYYEDLPQMVENIGELNSFIEDMGGEFLFVGLPSQSSFYRNKYQSYFTNKDDYLNKNEARMFGGLEENGVSYINMNKVFEND